MAVFEAADKDKSGTLTVEEFNDVMDDIILRYPQFKLYMKSQHLPDLTHVWKDSQGNEKEEIDIEGFKLALSHVDSQMKSLPATAQVCITLLVTESLLVQTPLYSNIICDNILCYTWGTKV